MENIIKIFEIDETRILELKESSTSFIKKYFNEKDNQDLFYYLDELDSDCDEYLQFGADKCSVNNFTEFCEDLNISIEDNLTRMIDEQIKIKNDIINNRYNEKNDPFKDNFKRYTFYSRDNMITFTCSNFGNYMHYFGITGEYNKILDAFNVFCKRCTFDDACIGNRDFI